MVAWDWKAGGFVAEAGGFLTNVPIGDFGGLRLYRLPILGLAKCTVWRFGACQSVHFGEIRPVWMYHFGNG